MSEQPPLNDIAEPLFLKNAAAYWRIVFYLEGILFPFSLLMVLTVPDYTFLGKIIFVSITSLALFPLCLIFAGTQVAYLHQKIGKVYYDGETVSLFDRACNHTYSAKLADCRWFIGSRTWATVPQRVDTFGLGTGKAFLIVFPDSIKKKWVGLKRRKWQITRYESFFGGPVIVAAGLTPETRLQWEQAAARWDVEEDARLSSKPPLSTEFISLWLLLSGFGSLFLGGGIAKSILVLSNLGAVPVDIAKGIALPFVMPGFMYLFLLLFRLPFFGRRQELIFYVKRFFRYAGHRMFTPLETMAALSVPSICVLIGYWEMIDRMNDWTQRSASVATFVIAAMPWLILYPMYTLWRDVNRSQCKPD